jgi:hypothetical protein
MQLDYPSEEADKKAMHLPARVQGIAMLSHVFYDHDFLVREVEGLI